VTYTDGKTTKVPFLVVRTGVIAYIHPSSSCAGCHPPPEFVSYALLQRSSVRPGGEESDTLQASINQTDKRGAVYHRTFMKGVTALTQQWLNEIGYDEDEAATPFTEQEV
jgi:hypothetical protein